MTMNLENDKLFRRRLHKDYKQMQKDEQERNKYSPEEKRYLKFTRKTDTRLKRIKDR